MTRKPRILYVGEAHFLATGYSNYSLEVQKYLHATGKYEMAELSAFASENDPRLHMVPWECYGNFPADEHGREAEEYWKKKTNEFGEFRFEDVCLRFRPDIVWSIRDYWMDEFIERSPFRDYFRWVYMPTVDATPQHEQWLATFMNADAVFCYSDWGTRVLEEEGGGLIRTVGSAPPCVDTDVFRPVDKKELRRQFHFEDDVFVVGTVMRNQGRKLYPELVEAFALFLKQAPADIAKRTFLYLHTSYPDQGWDIPRLIKKHGVSHKTLITYKCKRCHAVFPSFFMDAIGPCADCGAPSARMPDVQAGVDRATLAKVINLFDVYVQYANSEGFGMPQVEAAACGVPVFATDYSAMSDVVRKVAGYPIKVAGYSTDTDFGCMRARPDGQDFIDKLIRFFSLSDAQRFEKGKAARRGVEKHYTWKQTAKKWETVFDRLTGDSDSRETTPWTAPRRVFTPEKPPSNNFSTNEEMVRWCLSHVLGRPDMANSYLAVRLIRDLNWGKTPKKIGSYFNESSFITLRGDYTDFTPEQMIAELTDMRGNINKWEERRWQTVQGLG